MNGALAFAWRSVVRQPARSTLGILGVAAVGALLLDMLLLADGLVLSMRELLERMNFDVRVTAGEAFPAVGPDLVEAAAAAEIAALPTVRSVTPVRSEDAEIRYRDTRVRGALIGISGPRRLWTTLRGADPSGPRELVLNQHAAETLGVEPGASVTLRAFCGSVDAAPPAVSFRVAGVAELPFEMPGAGSAAMMLPELEGACGTPAAGSAHFLAVTSAGDPAAAADAIEAARGDLRAFTNDELINRLQQGGFTYFRQISTVLATITMIFALLLITVLLTVSVNQRLGEVAALRALGFSQRRLVFDVLCESALIVGTGGALSVPLGLLLAAWLDAILKRMPNIPAQMHFFVFEPQALAVHGALLALTALLAAAYPMRIVARLPIAATLRNEVIS